MRPEEQRTENAEQPRAAGEFTAGLAAGEGSARGAASDSRAKEGRVKADDRRSRCARGVESSVPRRQRVEQSGAYTEAVDLDGAELLAELQRPDELTQRFTPHGLGISVQLSPEGAARFQTAAIAQAILANDVPQDVRDNFERARKLHRYGVLEYEFFTVAGDYALLVLEGALRVRFVSYYGGEITVLRGGAEEKFAARSFDEVRKIPRNAQLRSADDTLHPVPLGARALLDWARRERLLTGTRTRVVDHALAKLRDRAAHPATYTLTGPPNSAGTIRDVAEVVNKLWGHDTPGGHLFPAPLAREPRVAALARDRSKSTELRLDQVPAISEEMRDWEYVVVLATHEEDLTEIGGDGIRFAHQPGFQTTTFPAEELLRGTWNDLVAAIDAGTFSCCSDTMEHLDRLFFVRVSNDGIDYARSARDMLALAEPLIGDWYAIRADSPWDAWVHLRDHREMALKRDGSCPTCFVRVEATFKSPKEAVSHARRSLAI